MLKTQPVPIPPLPENKQYRLVLRLPSFSKAVFSEIGGGAIPNLDFGVKCICCDEITFRTEGIDPTRSSFKSIEKNFNIPVCENCAAHALSFKTGMSLSIWMIFLGLVGAVSTCSGMMKQNAFDSPILMVFVGLSILLVLAGIFLYFRQMIKNHKKEEGHCPQANLMSLRNEELILETSNIRLVKHILNKHANVVAHLGTTEMTYAESFAAIDLI